MSGRASRDKGRRGENEFAKCIGGKRISESGSGGPDVFGLGRTWEVKRRLPATATKLGDLTMAYRFLDEARRKGGSRCIPAIREDKREWLLIVPLTEYLEEVGGKYAQVEDTLY